MRSFVVMIMCFICISTIQAQAILDNVISIKLGSSLIDVRQYAQVRGWKSVAYSDVEAWSKPESEAFLGLRQRTSYRDIHVHVYSVSILNEAVDVFFFFNTDRLFAINIFLETFSEQQFVQLIKEIGGPVEKGYLGYGSPLELDGSPFAAYMWYINQNLTQTIIVTYFGDNIRPKLKIQVMDEVLGR